MEQEQNQENITRRVADPEGHLTRRERRKLWREQEKEGEGRNKNFKKLFAVLLIAVLLIGSGWWLYKQSKKLVTNTQAIGEAVSDMGKNHVTDIAGVTYNSNPPTSGPHFPIWAKKGMYDRVISDGYLLHSLEHGYVVISYNCEKLITYHLSLITSASAHETEEPHEEPATPSGETKALTRMTFEPKAGMSWFTPDNAPPAEVELPESFKSEDCQKLVGNLREIGDDFQKVIVVPRNNLDMPIALTAWGRIDKLTSFDKERIKSFISRYHNRGPEKTKE